MPRTDGGQPRGAKLRSQVIARPTAMVASAQRMDQISDDALRPGNAIKFEQWQTAAWHAFDTIAEYRYGVNWVGNLLSKAVLKVHYDGKESTNEEANQILASLYGGNHAEMLREFGIHLTVCGDAYLVGSEDENGDDDWMVAAATEIKRQSEDNYKVGDEEFVDPLVIRLWRPHPRLRKFSDAPTRPLLPILSEIDGLTKHVSAQIDSRLTSAGILILPQEISFASTVPGTNVKADDVVTELIKTANAAIANRENPSALVPIVLQVPGEYVDKVHHLTFWSELDENAIKLREEAIRRLALGMDMPPEVLTGTSDMNHWNAWQVEEASIKAHTEPLLEVIAQSLTDAFLRPTLEADSDEGAAGMDPEEARRYTIAVDSSKLRLRPNRSKEAMELYDRGELSGEAVLRENGFDPADKMGDDEFKRWVIKKIAGGSTTPELVEAAVRELGVALEVRAPEEESENGTEARPVRSLDEHPTRELPEEEAVAAAAYMAVFRALERAGNRMRTKMNAKIAGVSAFETYQYVDQTLTESDFEFLLADAWVPAAKFASGRGMNAQEFVETLDDYACNLLRTRAELTESGIREHLFPKKAAA